MLFVYKFELTDCEFHIFAVFIAVFRDIEAQNDHVVQIFDFVKRQGDGGSCFIFDVGELQSIEYINSMAV